jgi:nitroreductase/NAD-dependent dihydropyrimidine dehydrogenase PreA subunit
MSQTDRGYRLDIRGLRPNSTRIDADLCNGCGLCVEDCPAQALSMVDGVAVVTGEESLGCDHCAAICPTDAVTVGDVRPELTRLETLEVPDRWLRYGDYPAEDLVQLMRSRRSCRSYTDKPVAQATLRDLVRIGMSAPSGSNWQPWTFTLLPDRATVLACGDSVLRFYRKLNKTASSRVPRLVSRLVMKGDPLGTYARQYRDKMNERIRDYEDHGTDHLFHDAPAAIVIATRPGALPGEDAMLAAQNILLAAHAMGLGTCLIGFAVQGMRRDSKIQSALGIPREETVRAVIAVGHSKRRYQRTTGRLDAPIRVARRG